MVHADALIEHFDQRELGTDLGAQKVLNQPDVGRHLVHLRKAQCRFTGIFQTVGILLATATLVPRADMTAPIAAV